MTLIAAGITAIGILFVIGAFLSVFGMVMGVGDQDGPLVGVSLVLFLLFTSLALWLLDNADKF